MAYFPAFSATKRAKNEVSPRKPDVKKGVQLKIGTFNDDYSCLLLTSNLPINLGYQKKYPDF